MKSSPISLVVLCLAALLVAVSPALACPITTFDGSGSYASFSDLASGYRSFMGTPEDSISFSQMPQGFNPVADAFTGAKGVTFSNEGNSAILLPEGNQVVSGWYQGNLAGYDGSYMPDGSTVYNMINDDCANAPLTITFAKPVSSVGSYIANSAGAASSLTMSLFDAGNHLLGTVTAQVNPWGDCDNIEGFWGAKADTPQIAKVTILSQGCYGVATMDNLEWSHGDAVPEPATLSLLVFGGLALIGRRCLA